VTEADLKKLSRECRIEFFRASGPGGQRRNKVETGVRIVHIPTGLRARASERRSQARNRAEALRRLAARLALLRRRRRPRIPTRKTRAVRAAELKSKKLDSLKKRSRHAPSQES